MHHVRRIILKWHLSHPSLVVLQSSTWTLRSYSLKAVEEPPKRPGLIARIKDGVVHYWDGTKLLALETRISWGLLKKLLKGEKLIRREYVQLVKTSSDLLRLVPFLIIAIVPFLEFALPIILKIFPNMLPSTYESKLQTEERLRKQLDAKIKVARLLQDSAETIAREDAQLVQLNELFRKARITGTTLSAQEVITVSKNLYNTVKLDGLPRQELLNLCKYMGLNAFGTDNYLKFQLRKAIERLKSDDIMISEEGVDSLSLEELRQACHARGIRTFDVTEDKMRLELQQWLDLHLVYQIPPLFLVLSRALILTPANLDETVLGQISGTLPSEAIKNVYKAAQMESTLTIKMDSIKNEQEKIQKELQDLKTTPTDKDDTVEKVSHAIADLVSPSESREALENLKKGVRAGHHVGSKNLERSVEKLIDNIESDLLKLEEEIKTRLDYIRPELSADGTFTADDIKKLVELVRDSPKDYLSIREIMDRFDKDKDGKVFIDDIVLYMKQRKHEVQLQEDAIETKRSDPSKHRESD